MTKVSWYAHCDNAHDSGGDGGDGDGDDSGDGDKGRTEPCHLQAAFLWPWAAA